SLALAEERSASSHPGRPRGCDAWRRYCPTSQRAMESYLLMPGLRTFSSPPGRCGLLVQDMTTGTKTILLVDDEVRERKRLRVILSNAGYGVIEARDFHEARATYQRRRDEIQMLLIDVSLPGNNGCELAKSARAHDPEVKVLLMSGQAGAEICKFY